MVRRFLRYAGAASFLLVFLLGGLAACASKRPLTLPTTPPSEVDENPGPDAPPISDSECQTPEECFEEGVRRWEENDHDGARAALSGVRVHFPHSIWASRSAFLLGRWSAEIGSPFADHYFEDARKALPVLNAYIGYYSALGHFNGGRFEKALAVLEQHKRDYPESVLEKQAGILQARTLISFGRCDLAFLDFDARGESPPEILSMKADCAQKEGDDERYARLLQEVWFNMPGTAYAEEAGKRLDRLQSLGFSLPEPSFDARLIRANHLMSSARFHEAESAFVSLAEDFPGEFRSSLRVRQGEALFRLRKNEKAIRLFKQVVEESTDPREIRRSLFWLARIAVRQDEDSRLMEIERELAGLAPGSPQRIRALFYVGDAFDDSGDRKNAAAVYRTIMENYPATKTAEESAWRLGWMAYRHGDSHEAIRVFRRFVDGNPNNPENGRYWYWIGRSAEKTGQGALAAWAYEKTCDIKRLSFYCQLLESSVRLGARSLMKPAAGVVEVSFSRNGGTEAFGGAVPLSQVFNAEDLPLYDAPGYRAARELVALKMIPEATRELSLLGWKYKDPGSLLFLSGLFSELGDPYRSMRLVRLNFNKQIVEKNTETPLWFWKLAFPSSFVRETLDQYPVSGIDPYLVSAVAREESAFNPEVVSAAGAVGLMQLMPETGKRVARETGFGEIREEDLKNPTINIRLGSRYLKSLIRRFEGNWVLAVAAYNAGPEAVSKWLEQGIGDIEEFVESIPYRETRNYTKRVSLSYYEYRRISKIETPETSMRPLPFFP